jgi:hypothetical protein
MEAPWDSVAAGANHCSHHVSETIPWPDEFIISLLSLTEDSIALMTRPRAYLIESHSLCSPHGFADFAGDPLYDLPTGTIMVRRAHSDGDGDWGQTDGAGRGSERREISPLKPPIPSRRTIRGLCRALGLVILIWSRVSLVAGEVDFATEVRPIFASRCFQCHGPDQQKSSLRVDSRAELLDGGDSGPAIVPGEPDASYLIDLVSSDDPDVRMPPTGEPLTAEQISRLRQWIHEGAHAADEKVDAKAQHWSFQPVTRPPVPTLDQDSANPVDAFLLSKLTEQGQGMSPAADARTFIRRVTLILTGLPPTPTEVEAFVQDCATTDAGCALPDAAVAGLVDRLLASPQYGERWAQHWLDVIRYADTSGYEKNKVRPSAWPYRDYVIAALNADIPWPRFLLEQLAGDTLGMDPATGFLVTPPFPEPIEVGQEPSLIAQVRFNGLDEVVQNVSSSMLGLTVGCARCHDHKFDPVSTKDYYRLTANFAGMEFADRAWDSGAVPVEQTDRIERRMAQIRHQLQTYPAWREVEPTRTMEVFPTVRARWVRMQIIASADAEYAPAIDEFQVWTRSENGVPSRNVGLAENGAVARSSGGDAALRSKDGFLNDGRHGEQSLWVAADRVDQADVWVEVELPQVRVIDRVSWCRDPLHLSPDFIRLSKRSPSAYRIEAAERPGEWRTVAGLPRTAPLEKSDAEQRNKLEDEFSAQARRLRDLKHVFAGDFRTPDPMHVLRRGDPQQRREPIGPGGIDVLGGYELPLETPDPARRLALAEWLGSADHPLTSRVIVNRVWQHHFGTGIVDTPSDFGAQGERPSHPELLDWLASEFMSRGWRLKELHRLICTSRAFRQSSRPNAAALAIDADTRLLWRFPPRRLEAEAIRDSLLSVSGTLDPAAGGPGVNLYQSGRYGSEYRPKEDLGAGPWRRTIYLLRVRGADDGLFKAFDVPDCGQVRPRRSESTTPLQALNLFNSPFIQQLAEHLATRVKREAGRDMPQQIERLYALMLSRSPTSTERAACVAAAEMEGLETVCRALFNSNEFLFIE